MPEERRIDGESRERLTALLDGLESERAASCQDRAAAKEERERNAEMRDVVLGSSRRMAWLQRLTLGLAVVAVALGATLGVTLYRLHQQGLKRNHETRHLLATAKESTLTTCTLLSNIAKQAGVLGTGGDASEAVKVQRKLIGQVFDVAIRNMTSAERARFGVLYHDFQHAGSYVQLPNCRQVADHPESVKQLGATTKQAKPAVGER